MYGLPEYTNTFGVVLVDMQSYYIGSVPSDELDRITGNQLDIIDHCTSHNIPLAALENRYRGRTIGKLRERIEEISKHVFITKPYDDGFLYTSLGKTLEKWDVNCILLMGTSAWCCVKSTGEGALKRGLKIATAEDLIIGREPKASSWYARKGVFMTDHTDLHGYLVNGHDPHLVHLDDDDLRATSKVGWRVVETVNSDHDPSGQSFETVARGGVNMERNIYQCRHSTNPEEAIEMHGRIVEDFLYEKLSFRLRRFIMSFLYS